MVTPKDGRAPSGLSERFPEAHVPDTNRPPAGVPARLTPRYGFTMSKSRAQTRPRNSASAERGILSRTCMNAKSRRDAPARCVFEEQGIFPCLPQCMRDPRATPGRNCSSAASPARHRAAAKNKATLNLLPNSVVPASGCRVNRTSHPMRRTARSRRARRGSSNRTACPRSKATTCPRKFGRRHFMSPMYRELFRL